MLQGRTSERELTCCVKFPIGHLTTALLRGYLLLSEGPICDHHLAS